MKAIIFILFLGLSLTSFSQAYTQEIPEEYGFKVKIGETVPDFNLVLPDGTSTPVKDLRGKVVMLQFTASWCSVCRKEMPHIESDIWKRWKNNPDFALFGIDLKEDAKKTAKFQKDMNISYPLALDLDGSIFEQFTVANAGVTRNIIVDKEGKIAYVTRLFKEDEFKEMVEVIGELVQSP